MIAVDYSKDLYIQFSGSNTLATNNHLVSRVLFIDGHTTMSGIGENAVLNIIGGNSTQNGVEVNAAWFMNLTVISGTVNFTSGSGSISYALTAGETITVNAGAVVNAHAGTGEQYSVGVIAPFITVEGTLNGTSAAVGQGINGFLTADIICVSDSIGGSGTVNGLCVCLIQNESLELKTQVAGNTVIAYDRTVCV